MKQRENLRRVYDYRRLFFYRLDFFRQRSGKFLLINRDKKFIIPKGNTTLERGDTLLIFGERARLSEVEKNLSRRVIEDEK